MATSSLIGRRVFLAAAKRSTYQQALQSSALRAASTTSHYSHGDSSSSASSASRFGLLGAAGAFALAANATNEKADCCGIAGVVGAKGDARDYLIEGLTILKNRGYDSAGIATMDDANPELVVSYFFVSTSIDQPRSSILSIHLHLTPHHHLSPPPLLLTPGYQIRLRR